MLAHQGGWDEILLVAGPILLIVGLLALVKRRIDQATADTPDNAPEGAPAGTADDTD